ncbi:MAG: flagellar biosynthetic protein FliR [Acidobacteria bacterium]|nr:MAG: flagellar biosynthetic protein FliR [Acidobacteriota bacterium]
MDFAVVARLGLLLVRPAALVATMPPFGSGYTPALVKIGLSLLLAVTMAPLVAVPAVETAVGLAVMAGHELLVGIALGMGLRVLLAGAELAGQLAGFQLGLSFAAAVDPQTGARNNTIAALYGNLALFAVLAANAHHYVLRALARSYVAVPLGAGGIARSLGAAVARMLGAIFTIGTQLAAPIVVVLLVVELGLGLVTRAAPALNMMVVGFPVRLLAGLIVLAATVPIVVGAAHQAAPRLIDLASHLAAAFK